MQGADGGRKETERRGDGGSPQKVRAIGSCAHQYLIADAEFNAECKKVFVINCREIHYMYLLMTI